MLVILTGMVRVVMLQPTKALIPILVNFEFVGMVMVVRLLQE